MTGITTSGARWVRAALQVNLYEYHGRNAPSATYATEDYYNKALLDECGVQGIELFAITDHWKVDSALQLIHYHPGGQINDRCQMQWALPGVEVVSGCESQRRLEGASVYLDLHAEYSKRREVEKERINEDVVFEIELVKQVEVNVDYILMLVEKYRNERGDGDDKEIRAEISRAVDASPSLRNKKDLVENFVDSISADGSVDAEWAAYVAARREAELEAIVSEEKLRPVETRLFVELAFANGEAPTAGTGPTGIMPPTSRFGAQNNLGEKKRRVLKKLEVFFERFAGLGS